MPPRSAASSASPPSTRSARSSRGRTSSPARSEPQRPRRRFGSTTRSPRARSSSAIAVSCGPAPSMAVIPLVITAPASSTGTPSRSLGERARRGAGALVPGRRARRSAQHQPGGPFWVAAHPPEVDALATEIRSDPIPGLIRTETAHPRGPKSQPREPDARVALGTAVRHAELGCLGERDPDGDEREHGLTQRDDIGNRRHRRPASRTTRRARSVSARRSPGVAGGVAPTSAEPSPTHVAPASNHDLTSAGSMPPVGTKRTSENGPRRTRR